MRVMRSWRSMACVPRGVRGRAKSAFGLLLCLDHSSERGCIAAECRRARRSQSPRQVAARRRRRADPTTARWRAACWVGAERLAQSRFLDSPHRTGHARFPSDPALQGLSLLPGSHPPVRTPSISAFNARTSSGSGLVLSGMTRLWFPSPCGRLSRPPTTMEPPTLPMFLFPTAGNIRFRAASHVHDRGLCEVV